jgi:hypothetical protein
LEQPKRGRKAKVSNAQTLAVGLSALFGTVAMIRGSHWMKTTQECMIVATPLDEYMQSLNPKATKAIEKAMLPLTLAIGTFHLMYAPIKRETEIIKDVRHAKESIRNSQATNDTEQSRTASFIEGNETGIRRYSPTLAADSVGASSD